MPWTMIITSVIMIIAKWQFESKGHPLVHTNNLPSPNSSLLRFPTIGIYQCWLDIVKRLVINMHNAMVSNYSDSNFAHFLYLELLVISLSKSFHISLFMYLYANLGFFIIHICCYVFMRSQIWIFTLYMSWIWCLQFWYVHLDMHIPSKFRVFNLPLSLGLLYVTSKFCKINIKSFTPPTNFFLCVWEYEV